MSTFSEHEVTFDLFELTGSCPFVGDGDKGQRILRETLLPHLEQGKVVVILCDGIENMNDSFANAFFGPLTLHWGERKQVKIKGCSELVKSFICSAWEMERRACQRDVQRRILEEEAKWEAEQKRNGN